MIATVQLSHTAAEQSASLLYTYSNDRDIPFIRVTVPCHGTPDCTNVFIIIVVIAVKFGCAGGGGELYLGSNVPSQVTQVNMESARLAGVRGRSSERNGCGALCSRERFFQWAT